MGVCLPGTSEDSIAISSSSVSTITTSEPSSTEKEQIPANIEGTQSMQCNNMMHDHDMAI